MDLRQQQLKERNVQLLHAATKGIILDCTSPVFKYSFSKRNQSLDFEILI